MSKNKPESPDSQNEDFGLFREVFGTVKPLRQDKVVPERQEKLKAKLQARPKSTLQERQRTASFAFSDLYQAALPQSGPMRFCRADVATHRLKQLRRGDYSPELILDMHGLNREAAKQELSALLHTAHKQLIDCVAVVHGIGSGVLKTALPHLLIQHPHVMAFHQAPLEYGGHGALLVLVETAEPDFNPFS
ncbi:endonuclease SmrB [Salinimonas chungwhensis]|uniref:endonuclease SmrB n=1 Tax=Salinimonas chungwhensis TaxID=265425 RepID=UPI00035F9D93|nr:endonuclease SmrB [Salinimonas chungwhensis]